jgi:peptidoglycan/LPS O-acetylase OafA/YrhL
VTVGVPVATGLECVNPAPVASPPLTPAPGAGSDVRYQPALDGMRACAVLFVLMFHGGQSWAPGGYLGVDVFFVLSGFLITTLLVAEWERHGRIDVRAFWVRRARRLLPALFLLMVGICVYAACFEARAGLAQIRNDAFATLAYVSNWRWAFVGQEVFKHAIITSPLRHTWSLAMEEQFYLLWPLLVVVVLRWLRSPRVLMAMSALGAAGSAWLMGHFFTQGHDPVHQYDRAYYGTDARIHALLIGAALGILLLRHGPLRSHAARWLAHLAALGGAALVAWKVASLGSYGGKGYFTGWAVAVEVATAVIVLSVVQPDRGLLGFVLALAPLRWMGRISYGLYLWHWPVFLTMNPDRMNLRGDALLFARLGVTFAISIASFLMLEQPIRHGALRQWHPGVLIVAVIAMLAVAIVLTTT